MHQGLYQTVSWSVALASAYGDRSLLTLGQLPILMAERVNPRLAHPARVEAALSSVW